MRTKTIPGITKALEALPDGKRAIIRLLIAEAVFMQETVEKLKSTIRQQGTLDKDGRETAAFAAYKATLPKYTGILKQLCDAIGSDASGKDALDSFMAESRD